MGTFESGFKAHCEKLAVDIRAELGLERYARLEMEVLADHLAIPIIPIGACGAPPEVVTWAAGAGSACFSALTMPDHTGARVIVLNDCHPPPRRQSDLAHELAHALLMHEPAPVNSGDGTRSYTSMLEREAEHLGGALLVPRPMAVGVVRRGRPLAAAAAEIGVSEQMLQYRIQVTGARR